MLAFASERAGFPGEGQVLDWGSWGSGQVGCCVVHGLDSRSYCDVCWPGVRCWDVAGDRRRTDRETLSAAVHLDHPPCVDELGHKDLENRGHWLERRDGAV